MPYPSQITRDMIVDAARLTIETEGVDALSLNRLAKTLGVKTPSLYNYVQNKDALLQAVNTQITMRLFEAMDAALAEVGSDDPAERLLAAAQGYRGFAHAHPRTFVMAMTEPEPARQPDPDALVQMVLPLQAMVAEIVGEARSLIALRGLYAVIHGFVLAELTGQLRRGGDLSVAFVEAVKAQIRGMAG